MTNATTIRLMCAFAFAFSAFRPTLVRADEWSELPAEDEKPYEAGVLLPLDPFHAGFGLSLGTGWLNTQAADSQQIGDSGLSFRMSVIAELFDLVSTAFAFGTIFVSDQGSFKQQVVTEFDQTEAGEAESTLNLYFFTVSGGLRTPDLSIAQLSAPAQRAALNGFVRFGRAWISGSRAIQQCVDCHEETLALADGSILEVGANVGMRFDDGIGLSAFAGYRHFFRAAAAGEIEVGFLIWYF